MKKLAYYYLEQSELLYDDDDVDRTVASSSSSTSSETTTTTPSGALLSLGLGWLQCAYHVGYDRDAAYELAVLYEYGHYHIPIDIVWAVHYFEIAACAGHVEAMVELALCYELGCGVTVNDEVALDWYLRAAAAGHTIAKYSVGEAYERARGVPLSKEEACLWYYKAALAGDRDSIVALQRLQDIARIVIPGITTTLLLLNDTSG
jgi:TPR repeat protein